MSTAAQLLALVAPPVCVACAVPLVQADALVCAGCMRDLRWLGAGVCRRCGLPGHAGRACPAAKAPFSSAWAPLAHQGTARALVRALKFRGALPVAGLMASQIAANAPPWAVWTPVGAVASAPEAPGCPPAARAGVTTRALGMEYELAIVPVPAAPARRRARGFDPAALIAVALGERLDLPVAVCLARSGRAARQLGARRAERRAPGRIAVQTVRPPPRRALLVDDVHTTGATLSACATALRDNGTEEVKALSYVRAL